MSLTFSCQCGTKVEAKEDAKEKRVNCPNCGSVIFFGGLTSGDGVAETYGLAGGGAFGSSDDEALDADDAAAPLGWLDRFKDAPKARKAEHETTLNVVFKMGESSAASDPMAASLYLAATQPGSEMTVAALAKVAASGHPVYAPMAASFLECVGPSEGRCAREALKLLQENPEAPIAAILLKCLLAIGPAPSVHVRDLITVLGSRQSALYVWAVQCLGMIGPAARRAVDSLYKALKISDHDLRLAVIDALGSIRRDPERVVPLLMQALKHQNADYRRRGAAALGRFGAGAGAALPSLKAATQDESLVVRETAALALKALEAATQSGAGLASIAVATSSPAAESLLVPCACGKRLRIKIALAGRKVKCPACGGVVAVPAAPAAKAATAPAAKHPEEKECPSCLATLPAAVILCVHCGLDFRTGKQLGAAVAAPAGAPAP